MEWKPQNIDGDVEMLKRSHILLSILSYEEGREVISWGYGYWESKELGGKILNVWNSLCENKNSVGGTIMAF